MCAAASAAHQRHSALQRAPLISVPAACTYCSRGMRNSHHWSNAEKKSAAAGARGVHQHRGLGFLESHTSITVQPDRCAPEQKSGNTHLPNAVHQHQPKPADYLKVAPSHPGTSSPRTAAPSRGDATGDSAPSARTGTAGGESGPGA